MSDVPPETTFGRENAPESPPPDAFVGAFALLMRPEGPDSYLAVRDETELDEAGLDLIRAVREEGSTYRDSLVAAIGQRLGLDAKRDLVASGVPRAHLNSRLCGGGDTPRWYVCEFFEVRLFGKRWRDTLAGRDDFVWLTGHEVMAGGRPGLPLRRDVAELLTIAEAIPPDQR